MGSTVNRGVFISVGYNRGIPLYTEVSSFQGIGIEKFHCIQRFPHFRGLKYSNIEVSSFQGLESIDCRYSW